ncbi:MFS transporter [Actinomadura sp. CNU-125]|uniref:MFS transporter n=1 Tax=Actinomadura sp. CNU-125 TaxID=1904961 RepID=UPI0021CC6397|nr:MFS transporter [Actinomadura sp. CNU-125]
MIAARAVQGVGNALITPSALAIVRSVFPPAELRGRLAAWGAAASAGMVAGPVAGGLLTEHFGWRALFLANARGAARGRWGDRVRRARRARTRGGTGRRGRRAGRSSPSSTR